ncbi:MAG: copper transporter [Coriobacteriia bacterium]|nr:copper transporter [Coriobacteriia bacterium]
MYNMRYHLASLISVFLALSIGLILGGLLADRSPENVHDVLLEGIQREIAQTRESNTQLRLENRIAYDFADMLYGDFAHGKLEDKTIIVLGPEGQEARMAISAVESAGASAVLLTPEYDELARVWTILGDFDFENTAFAGIVSVYDPTATVAAAAAADAAADENTNGANTAAAVDAQYAEGYLSFVSELVQYHAVPLIIASIEDDASSLASLAWDHGLSGTNQLGNRYGSYTLVVLLGSDTAGMFGNFDEESQLYPPIPATWTIDAPPAETPAAETPTAETPTTE